MAFVTTDLLSQGPDVAAQFVGRFCRKASMPSRASSETNNRDDCSVSS
jgi:hypothetical protein